MVAYVDAMYAGLAWPCFLSEGSLMAIALATASLSYQFVEDCPLYAWCLDSSPLIEIQAMHSFTHASSDGLPCFGDGDPCIPIPKLSVARHTIAIGTTGWQAC